MIAAFRAPGLTATEKIVLAVISWHDGPGGAWPSYQRIADMAGIKRAAAGRAIKALIEKGRLIRRRGRTTNRFIPIVDCQEIPDSEFHCQEKADSEAVSVSGNLQFHCQEFPDTNRKNRNLSNLGIE